MRKQVTSGTKNIWRWPTGLRLADDDKQDIKKVLMSIIAKNSLLRQEGPQKRFGDEQGYGTEELHLYVRSCLCSYHVASND